MKGKLTLALLGLSSLSLAATFTVTNPAEFQNALNTAEDNREDDTIIVAPGTYNISSTLTYSAALSETNSLTIVAQDPNNPPVLDGGGSTAIMYISTRGDVTIDGLIFRNGSNASGNGGALEIDPRRDVNVVIRNCVFENNTAQKGGAIYLDSFTRDPTVSIENCRFLSNRATSGDGGAVFIDIDDSTIQVRNSIFENNVSRDDGGAAYLWVDSPDPPETILVENSTFRNNQAQNSTADGGGLYIEVDDANVSVVNSVFENNTAGDEGGGLYAFIDRDGDITVEGSRFAGNRADLDGGGAYLKADRDNLFIRNSVFENNTAAGDGGGAYADASDVFELERSLFMGNNAASIGGGLYARTRSAWNTILITNNVFWNNTAGSLGGGMRLWTEGDPYFINNTFAFNTGSRGGGLRLDFVFATWPDVYIYNNIFWQNTASTAEGDDLYVDDANDVNRLELFNNNFSGNADFDSPFSEDLFFDNPIANYSHGNNLQEDPLFVSATDYHLQGTSPMINAGSNSAPNLPATDIDGEPRIQDGNVDIGADEAPLVVQTAPQPQPPPPVVVAPPAAATSADPRTGVDVGVVSAGQARSHTITITNEGQAPLNIYSVNLQPPQPPQSLLTAYQAVNSVNGFRISRDECSGAYLQRFMSCDVEVVFEAPDSPGVYRAELVVETNDPRNSQLRIPLTAKVNSDPQVASGGGGCSTAGGLNFTWLVLLVFIIRMYIYKHKL